MDELVVAALAKWPNVPACTGWLRLDRRGQWRMRDDACQAAGEAGDPIRHVALKAFIERNYEADSAGRWFFQNGPQRVFVDLAYTPYVVRLQFDDALPSLTDQCGKPFLPNACYLDDEGNVLFSSPAAHEGNGESCEETIALLHDHDLALFAECLLDENESSTMAQDRDTISNVTSVSWVQGKRLPVVQIHAMDVPKKFAFVPAPVLTA